MQEVRLQMDIWLEKTAQGLNKMREQMFDKILQFR